MEAYVTLLATDTYAPGALVLAHRLRDLGTTRAIVCVVASEISDRTLHLLSKVFDSVVKVDTIRSRNHDNLRLLGRPELDITFTKIQVWNLSQYSKVVFLDADILPVKNVDILFSRPAFSAAPDAGWPDCFNSGVFVAQPSRTIYQDLIDLANTKGSFDGGDQGLLNSYFSSWPETNQHRIPFTFNTTPSASYSYVPAYIEFRHEISIVHFVGRDKPWSLQRFTDGTSFYRGGHAEYVEMWWDTWNKHYGKIGPSELCFASSQISAPHNLLNHNKSLLPTIDAQRKAAWDIPDIHRHMEKVQQKLHKLSGPFSSFTKSYAMDMLSNQADISSKPNSRYRVQEEHTLAVSGNNIKTPRYKDQSEITASTTKSSVEWTCERSYLSNTSDSIKHVIAEGKSKEDSATDSVSMPARHVDPCLEGSRAYSKNNSGKRSGSLHAGKRFNDTLQSFSYDSYRLPDLKYSPKNGAYSTSFRPGTVAEATSFKYGALKYDQ